MDRTIIKKSKWTKIKEGIHTVCPQCHLGFILSEKHKINNSGEVNPSYLCPRCNFHTFIILEGWK